MSLLDDLEAETKQIVKSGWTRRDGNVLPETEHLKLGNDCVDLEATFLYADLADSTELAIQSKDIAAEVAKAYLMGTTRIIRALQGEIRSFDSDRVMGVFFEGGKNTNAAEAALKINYFFTQILIPAFTDFYKARDLKLSQTVGVDTGKVMIVRTRIRNNNDLVWIGRAPNIAAKLSSIREGFASIISETVFNSMLEGSKYKLTTKELMWESKTWNKGSEYGVGTVYVSNWTWKP